MYGVLVPVIVLFVRTRRSLDTWRPQSQPCSMGIGVVVTEVPSAVHGASMIFTDVGGLRSRV